MDHPGFAPALSNLVRDASRALLAGLLPNACFLCGGTSPDDPLCPACEPLLPPHDAANACPACALPGTGGILCGTCLNEAPAFDRTYCAFQYAFPVRELVHALKYRGTLALAPALGRRLAGCCESGWDLVVPVPLHPTRVARRGFNQALEMARPVAERLGVPLALDVVERWRPGLPQAGLDARERARNLRGAFRLRGDVCGSRVLVVDDVMTSGATLREIGRELVAAGALRVANLVLARTPGSA